MNNQKNSSYAKASEGKPLISVIMPVYNAGKFLVPAIESILKQTYQNFEFIIVDDASTDGSWGIISSYKKADTRIKAIRLKTRLNKGGDACANIAFEKTQGKYIARMDADDIAKKNRLAVQVAYLKEHPEVLLLGSQAHVIDGKGKQIGEKHVPETYEEIYENYFIFHPIIHSTVMINRRLLPQRKHLYRIKYSANNDLLTFFELLSRGKFINLPDTLLSYRLHGNNDSLIKPKERFFNTLKIRFDALIAGYKPTIKSTALTLLETLVILVLPERCIVPVYMYMKGITSPMKKKSMPKFRFSPAFSSIKRYVYSLV